VTGELDAEEVAMTDQHLAQYLAQQIALREQILRSNLALRDWAAGLRQRSASAREAARARRAAPAGPTVPTVPAVPMVQSGTVPGTVPAAGLGAWAVASHLGPMPPLGQVEVSDLFVILVDQHGFEVMDAVRALATGLAVAGYPLDHDSVSAADALDILHHAVNPQEEGGHDD
jgi:hypothetical protein